MRGCGPCSPFRCWPPAGSSGSSTRAPAARSGSATARWASSSTRSRAGPGPGRSPRTGRTQRPTARLHAEIRSLAADVTDERLRSRLLGLLDLLDPAAPAPGTVALSRRELDVLALVAVGCGNGAVAERLGLTVHTVKSYLKSAMGKLDSHTRGEAVHAARGAGLIG